MTYLDNWIRYFTEKYTDHSYFYTKKAEYATILIHYLLMAICVIIYLEFSIVGDTYLEIPVTIFIILGFAFMLFLIRHKRLELAINLLIIAGFIRFFMIYFHPTAFQFYVMSLLNVVTVAVVHVKRYQCYWIYIGVFMLMAGKIPVMAELTQSGDIHWRAYTQSIYALVLFIIFVLMTEFIIELIHNEIKNSQELLTSANTDHLTGLLNRRAFWEEHRDDILPNENYSIVLMDIDRFKHVNDTLGHSEGDLVLVKLGNLLRRETNGYGDLYRWGGEEFLIFIPSVDAVTAILHAEALRKAIEQTELSQTIAITASFGVADNKGLRTLDDAISKADRAMYQSKIHGRNRVEIYEMIEINKGILEL